MNAWLAQVIKAAVAPPGRMTKKASEELAVTKSAQVLGAQFSRVLGFPHVSEYLDKEVEESFVNRSMRASSTA